jgi:pyruvate,orthophosphate dikinase
MTGFSPLFLGMRGHTGQLDRETAGSKAAELSRMAGLGLNVPPAFVLPTTLCEPVNRGDAHAMEALDAGLQDGIAKLEEAAGRRFGDDRAPLLVSVRSGAAESMPGMLSTVLDVGLNADSVRGLIGLTGNPRLAWDSYRRFLQMYAEVVEGMPAAEFSAAIDAMIASEQVAGESDLDPEALERLSRDFQSIISHAKGHPVPDDPMQQLKAAACAVFASWDGARAATYRKLNGIRHLAGTAVTVQTMVFGNSGGKSGAGVAFSRDPATGADALYVDFLLDAQGEDVVSGRRMPSNAEMLSARLPEIARELAAGAKRLEREFRDVQDMEFTVENGRLFFLQTRAAKRTPRAALRILVDFVREGILAKHEALERLSAIDLDRARLTHFAGPATAAAKATVAAPGVTSGRIAFDKSRAQTLAAAGEPVVLVTHDLATDDIAGLAVAEGALSATGSRTAHAAVVARQLGKTCLVGCGDLVFAAGGAELGGVHIAEGDWLSLDGETGEISLGRREIVSELPEAELKEIESWRRSQA